MEAKLNPDLLNQKRRAFGANQNWGVEQPYEPKNFDELGDKKRWEKMSRKAKKYRRDFEENPAEGESEWLSWDTRHFVPLSSSDYDSSTDMDEGFEPASPLRPIESEDEEEKETTAGGGFARIPKLKQGVARKSAIYVLMEARRMFEESHTIPILDDFCTELDISREVAKKALAQLVRENGFDWSYLRKRKKRPEGENLTPPKKRGRKYSPPGTGSLENPPPYSNDKKFQNALINILHKIRKKDNQSVLHVNTKLIDFGDKAVIHLDKMREKALLMGYTRVAGDFKEDLNSVFANSAKMRSQTKGDQAGATKGEYKQDAELQKLKKYADNLIYVCEKLLTRRAEEKLVGISHQPPEGNVDPKTGLWRVPKKKIYCKPDEEIKRTEQYVFDNPFPYEECWRYQLRGNLDMRTCRKLATKKCPTCDGKHCSRLSMMGPYDTSYEQWESPATCRKARVECSDGCACDPSTCKNQGITRGRRKKFNVQVKETPTFGIDQLVRSRIKDILTNGNSGSEDEVEAYITHGLLPQINNFLEDQKKYPECHTNKWIYEDQSKILGAPFFFTDILNMILYKCLNYKIDLTKVPREDLLSMTKCLTEYIDAHGEAAEMKQDPDEVPLGGDELDHFAQEFFPIYPKGNSVMCTDPEGINPNEFIVEYFGEVYPSYRWTERSEKIAELEKEVRQSDKPPEFYNIVLERHKDDPGGYDILWVDPHRKGNFASRLSHSCMPNCATVVMAVRRTYFIGLYALRRIEYGEELTFDYNSMTEKVKEYVDAVCLCGTEHCRGSYLYYKNANTKDADEDTMLLSAAAVVRATNNPELDQEDLAILDRNHIRSTLLVGLPEWVKKWAAETLRLVEAERKKLPQELMIRRFSEREAHFEAIGVQYSRIQSLAVTLDKIWYCIEKQSDKKKMSIRLLETSEIVDNLWNDPASSVRALLLSRLKVHGVNFDKLDLPAVVTRDKPGLRRCRELFEALKGLLREQTNTRGAYFDAAADLLRLYANTRHWFTIADLDEFKGDKFTYEDLDLVPKTHKLAKKECCKHYRKDFLLASQVYWIAATDDPKPDTTFEDESRGPLRLPDIDSCFSETTDQRLPGDVFDRHRLSQHVKATPWKAWPNFWHFRWGKNRMFGTPFLDRYIVRTESQREPKPS